MAASEKEWGFWSAVALAFGFFNIVAFAVWCARTYEEDQVARTRSGVSTVSPANGDGDLRIDAWTNTSRVLTGGMLPFSIAIQNPSTKTAVQDVRFVGFDAAEGFVVPDSGKDAACWSRDAEPKPICVTTDNLTAYPVRWPLMILPGGGTTVATRLRTIDEPGRWSLTAVIAWTDPLHHLSRRKGISLGPVVVENAVRKNLLLFAKAFQTYVKDLVWPQVAALFGVWVSRQDRRRTQQREAEKAADEAKAQLDREARASSERLAQENRAMVQQTWTLMLPISHRINTTYYMPISHTVAQIYTLHREIGLKRFAEEECFYFIWLLHKMMADFLTNEGGWYLKNRRAEEIVAAAWRTVRAWTDDVIARNTTQQAARAVREEAISRFPQDKSTFVFFTARVAQSAPFPELGAWFHAALHDPSAANIMIVFELMELVIDFEINRPYVYWYGGAAEMVEFDEQDYRRITEEFERTRQLLPKIEYDSALDILADEISRYRTEIQRTID